MPRTPRVPCSLGLDSTLRVSEAVSEAGGAPSARVNCSLCASCAQSDGGTVLRARPAPARPAARGRWRWRCGCLNLCCIFCTCHETLLGAALAWPRVCLLKNGSVYCKSWPPHTRPHPVRTGYPHTPTPGGTTTLKRRQGARAPGTIRI